MIIGSGNHPWKLDGMPVGVGSGIIGAVVQVYILHRVTEKRHSIGLKAATNLPFAQVFEYCGTWIQA